MPLSKTDAAPRRAADRLERARSPGPARPGRCAASAAARPAARRSGCRRRAGEDVAALVGVAGLHRPVHVDHQVGRRPRAAAASRSGRPAGRSGRCDQPSLRAHLAGQRGHRDVGEVAGALRRPTPTGAKSAALAVELDPAGRAGRRAAAARSSCRGRSSSWRARRSRTAARRGRAPRRRPRPSAGANSREDARSRSAAGSASQSPASAGPSLTSGTASSAGPASRAACSLAATSSAMSGVPVRATVPAAMPAPPSTKETTTTCRERIAPLVVRLLPAQRRLASRALDDVGDLAVGGGGGQRLLDQLLRRRAGAHRPPSWTVLRMFTSSNSAVGQPWLTGATWPGWALPQLNAPPST